MERVLALFAADAPAARWRLLALLWAVAGTVTVLVGALERGDGSGVLLGLGAFGVGAAVLVYGFAERLDPSLLGPVLAAGVTAIGLAAVSGGSTTAPLLVQYVWVGAQAWYFLGYRGAAALTLYGIGLSGVTLAVSDPPGDAMAAVAWWLVLSSSMLAVAALCAALRLRNDQLAARLRRVADTDELTGVLNRRGLSQRVALALAHHRRDGAPVALALVDVDQLGVVVERHGRFAGDELLRRFARCCSAELRVTDAVARVGGERFALLLPGSDGPSAVMVAERIRRRAASELRDPDNGSVTASVGVAACPSNAADADGLLDAADEALQTAQRAGRDLVLQASVGWPLAS